MARSLAECEEMAGAFEKKGLPLFVAYYRRALDRFVRTRELIQAGRLGTVTGVSYRFASPSHRLTDAANLPWRLVARESGGGLFMDLGCHTLGIIAFMVGELLCVEGRAMNLAGPYDVEDSVAMTFSLPGGALGTASWNFASATTEDIIEIRGTEAVVRLSTFGSEPVRIDTGAGTELLDLPNPKHIQLPLIRTIVSQLNGTGACPSTGQTAIRTAGVMDQVLDGYYDGRGDAFWDRPDTWIVLRNRR
jgi:predicted dehydrogenase